MVNKVAALSNDALLHGQIMNIIISQPITFGELMVCCGTSGKTKDA